MSQHLLIQQAKLDAAQIGFSTVFNNQLRVADPDPALALFMRVASQNASEEFKFMGDLPFLREWLDDRHMSKLRVESITVTNKDFAAGVRVDLNDIFDDRLGIVEPRIRMLADRARQHISDFAVRTMLNGFNGTNFPETGNGQSYDDQLFYSAAHQEGTGPTQSNFATAALDATAYEAGRVAMQSLVDEESQPLEMQPRLLLVGPSNERTARELVNSGLIDIAGSGAAVDNTFRGTADVVVSQRLVGTYANYWFLNDVSKPVKPLLWTDREAPRFDFLNSRDSESVFMRREAKAGTSYRAGFGYGLWHMSRGSDGTT